MKLKRIIIFLGVIIVIGVCYVYSTSFFVLRNLFPDKVWVHKVNNIAKLEEVSSLTSGIELDIVWENDVFDVRHPPEDSKGLFLEDIFRHLPDNPNFHIWLDFKNLNSTNAQASMSYLELLVEKYGFNKKNLIIESRNSSELKTFSEYGFKTSFYLPHGFDGKKAPELAKNIRSKQKIYTTEFLSTSLGEYVYVRDYFPDESKIIWYLGGRSGFKSKKRIYRALLDKRVTALLLPVNNKVH